MARKSRKNTLSNAAASENKMKLWRAALYIRLSVEFNGCRGDSLETQRQIMEAYVALCPDIEIVDVYTDNGISGQLFDRADFQRMLSDVEAGRIDCIIVKDLSRLGRSAIDTGYYIEKYFPMHQARFIAVNDQYDSLNPDNTSHIAVPLKNLINEAYAADIAKKIRSQAQTAMHAGQYIGSRPPYGYKKDERDCHKLLVNEETAPVVQEIFEWAARGDSLITLARHLNEKGIMTPGYYLASIGFSANERLMGSGKWQTRTILSILENEIYTGDTVQGKSMSVRKQQIKVEPDKWICVRNTHEPIISHELFEKVQRLLAERAAEYTARNKDKTPYTENILRGKIFCGCCGKILHRQRSHNRYRFRCISNERIENGACKESPTLREKELYQMILTYIRQEAEVVIGNDCRLRQIDPRIAERKKNAEQQIALLKKEAEQVKKHLASLYENYISGVLTKNEYLEMKMGYEKRSMEMVEQVRVLQDRQEALENKRSNYASIAKKLAAVEKDSILTATLVNDTIAKVVVNSSADISVEFSFKDDFSEVMEALKDA